MDPTKTEESKDSTEATKIESPNEVSSETTTYEQASGTSECLIINARKNESSSPYSVVTQEDSLYPQNSDKTFQRPCTGAVPKTSKSTKSSEAAIEFTPSHGNNKLRASVSPSENDSNIPISESVKQTVGSHNQSGDNAEAVFSEWIEEFGKILAWPAGEPCEVLLQFMETIEDLGFSFDSMFSTREESSNEEFARWLQSLSLETGVPVEVLTDSAQPASTKRSCAKCSLKAMAISEETSFVENKEKCGVPDALKEANKCMYEKSQFLGREVNNVKEKLIFIRKVRKSISEFQNPFKLHEDAIAKIRALVERKRKVLDFKESLKELHKIEEESSHCAINNVLQASMGRLNSEFRRSLQEMEKEVRTSESDLDEDQLSLNSENSSSPDSSLDRNSALILLGSHRMDVETNVSVRGQASVSSELISCNEQSRKCSKQPETSVSAAVIGERREEDIKLEDLQDSNKYTLEGLRLSKERRKIISALKVLFRKIFCNMLKLQRGHKKTHDSVTREISIDERYALTIQTKKLATRFSELLKMEMHISERILQINILMQELWIKVFLQIKDNRISEEVRVSALSYSLE